MRIHIIAMQQRSKAFFNMLKYEEMFPPRSQNGVPTQYSAELLQETIFWGPPKVFRLLQGNKYPVLHPDPIICFLESVKLMRIPRFHKHVKRKNLVKCLNVLIPYLNGRLWLVGWARKTCCCPPIVWLEKIAEFCSNISRRWLWSSRNKPEWVLHVDRQLEGG